MVLHICFFGSGTQTMLHEAFLSLLCAELNTIAFYMLLIFVILHADECD